MDTGSKKIARVFPRRTSATPHDELAFVGAITMETIAAIARAEPSEIHISATFTWDLPDVDELYESYSVFGVPVEVGGPAFGDRMGDFVPGMYIREGLVFTSRGCNKNCWFCSVPKCCNGEIRELPIVDGTCWQPLWSTSAACATCSCVSRNAPYFLGDLSRAC